MIIDAAQLSTSQLIGTVRAWLRQCDELIYVALIDGQSVALGRDDVSAGDEQLRALIEKQGGVGPQTE